MPKNFDHLCANSDGKPAKYDSPLRVTDRRLGDSSPRQVCVDCYKKDYAAQYPGAEVPAVE